VLALTTPLVLTTKLSVPAGVTWKDPLGWTLMTRLPPDRVAVTL